MIVTQARSPYRLRMNSQALTVWPPAMLRLLLLIWWHLVCREHRAPRQNSSQGGKRGGKAGREGLAECCQEAHWDAETVGFLLLLKRLSVSTRYHVVGSSLPLEPQEFSADHSRTHAHFTALLSCKGNCAPQNLGALEGLLHRFFLSC